MEHSEKPRNDLTKNEATILEEAKNRILNSPYYQMIQSKSIFIEGLIVKESIPGTSGFILIYNDRYYSVTHLNENYLDIYFGNEEISKLDLDKINSSSFGNASEPLNNKSFPYSDQFNDIAKELSNCHGLEITGFSIGENSFNICFMNDFELDTSIVSDNSGKLAIRVFWEQW
jgi:hypothetical protein